MKRSGCASIYFDILLSLAKTELWITVLNLKYKGGKFHILIWTLLNPSATSCSAPHNWLHSFQLISQSAFVVERGSFAIMYS